MRTSMQTIAKTLGGMAALVGVISLVLAPLVGATLSDTLWGVEPLTYIGAVLVIIGLGTVSLSYVIPSLITRRKRSGTEGQWGQITQDYFDLFQHDLGRPLRRILGKERELRAILDSSGAGADPAFMELLNEIERQAPNFRLMLSNIQVLVQLEASDTPLRSEPIEPSEVVRKIIDQYTSLATESQKEISWWAEPSEFGIVYSDSSALEHVVTNLVDNAVRFATTHVETRITRNPSHFFVRVWDDGPGITPQYIPHIFDRGWTPEVARREEKSSSGLGLFIGRTLAQRHGGDLTVESVAAPDPDHHTAFLLSLPLRQSGVTQP